MGFETEIRREVNKKNKSNRHFQQHHPFEWFQFYERTIPEEAKVVQHVVLYSEKLNERKIVWFVNCPFNTD